MKEGVSQPRAHGARHPSGVQIIGKTLLSIREGLFPGTADLEPGTFQNVKSYLL